MTASARSVLKRLYEEFGDRIAFVTLYVREAHPGEWYPQPETFEQKLQYARDYKKRDKIPWPVAVDNLEGDLHRTLDPKPNATYLMDIDGHVAFRTLWSNNEGALREGLAAVSSGRYRYNGENQSQMIPMLRGIGEMYDILGLAGQQARQDVWREVPPLYGMAWLASRFRPLPPLGRGIAAAATSLLGVIVLSRLGWKLLKGHER